MVNQSEPRRKEDRLPDSFFEVLGTWEDDQEPEEILRDIRQEAPQRAREELRPEGLPRKAGERKLDEK